MLEHNDYVTYEEIQRPEFNLVDAPDRELKHYLDRYGIPPRPDPATEPMLFEFWKKLVSLPFSSIRPTFSEAPMRAFHKIPAKVSPPPRSESPRTPERPSRGTVEWKWNWSGGIVSPPWPKRFVFATAGWVVPDVSRPSAQALFAHENTPKTMVWVGLDGAHAMLPKISLPQIGTAHWLDGPFPRFAWWDWWSHSSHSGVKRIDNFAIEVGDEILAGLSVFVSEDILFFIKNQRTGDFRSFLAKRGPLRAIEPLGSSIEWVVERPTHPESGKFYPLADYGSVDFKYCMARAADPDQPLAPTRVMTLADNGRMVEMREDFGNPYRAAYVSCAERRDDPDGSVGVRCTFHERS